MDIPRRRGGRGEHDPFHAAADTLGRVKEIPENDNGTRRVKVSITTQHNRQFIMVIFVFTNVFSWNTLAA